MKGYSCIVDGFTSMHTQVALKYTYWISKDEFMKLGGKIGGGERDWIWSCMHVWNSQTRRKSVHLSRPN